MPRTILVAVDIDVPPYRPGADRALAAGEALARRLGSPLDAVAVIPPGRSLDAAVVEERAAQAGAPLVHAHVRHDDDVADALLAAARSGDALLCLATHARDPVDDVTLQSTSSQVVRRSPAPVLLVGPAASPARPADLDAAVICVDGTAASDAVLAEGARWARLLAVPAHVLEVVEVATARPDSAGGGAGWTSQWFAGAFAGQDVDIVWDEVAGRDPAAAILAVLSRWAHPLVVMGTHGGPPGRPAPLGRVAGAVVARAPVPVLVVPPGTRRRPDAPGAAATSGDGPGRVERS
jgi:nucleotide-binding universal stress UspA family protein